MRFKTKFKDYVPETEFKHRYYWDTEVVEDKIWRAILNRYPKHRKSWDDIYKKVRDDFYENYDIDVNVSIKEKGANGI